MNKAALYASIAMLPALAYAPLTLAQPESQTKSQAITEMKPLEKPLGVGDTMPAFVIDDASGGKLDLAKILEKGPVVLSFYRGSWCPYCVTELSEIQSRLETISGTGATV
ncbi:MAG: redoxin domain-containing protein, partial [Phycisphaerales bacterium]